LVEVDQVEGKVVNILREISGARTDLVEFKPARATISS